MPAVLHLLGPQRPAPNLADALARAGVDGPIALITAGWRVDEGQIEPLVRHVQRPVIHLELYAWFEAVMAAHPALHRDYRARQDRILAAKRLYRARLESALRAFEATEALSGDPGIPEDLARSACEAAAQAVRDLDRWALQAVASVRGEYPHLERPWELDELAPTMALLRERLADAGALAIAGGHVGVLANRMQLMGFERWLPQLADGGTPIVAWAGGAMVLTRRVMLFYDDPPYGSGAAELFSAGFGLVPGLALFPHARRRLRVGDRARLARLVRRMAPDECLGMENGAWLELGEARVDHSRPCTLFSLDAVPAEICEGDE